MQQNMQQTSGPVQPTLEQLQALARRAGAEELQALLAMAAPLGPEAQRLVLDFAHHVAAAAETQIDAAVAATIAQIGADLG